MLLEECEFGGNYAVRLFGDSAKFIEHLVKILQIHPNGQKYEIRKTGGRRTFYWGDAIVEDNPFSAEYENAENHVEIWGINPPLECARRMRDLVVIAQDEKIPAHFGCYKGWSGPEKNRLVGCFYDPSWKK